MPREDGAMVDGGATRQQAEPGAWSAGSTAQGGAHEAGMGGLAGVSRQIGAPLLQRKLERRLQLKKAAAGEGKGKGKEAAAPPWQGKLVEAAFAVPTIGPPDAAGDEGAVPHGKEAAVDESGPRLAAGQRGRVIGDGAGGALQLDLGDDGMSPVRGGEGGRHVWVARRGVVVVDESKLSSEAADPDLVQLLALFKSAFDDVLPALLAVMPADAPCRRGAAPGKGTPELGPEDLRFLFSDEQRAQLRHYIATRLIPEGLFTSPQATGKATAQQRMFIASRILTDGVFPRMSKQGKPQDPDKLKATCCGTWVNAVLIYAGANPANAYAASSPDFITSLTGQITFGGGDMQSPYSIHHMPGLKPGETQQEQSKKYGASMSTARLIGLEEPWDKIAPGDWLYIDNGGNAGHSILFLRWLDDKVKSVAPGAADPVTGKVNGGSETVRYRTCEMYNQPTPEGGGTEGKSRLGFPYSKELHVSPVTNIQRMATDQHLPRTRDELLAFDRGEAVASNEAVLAKFKLSADRVTSHLAHGARALLESDKLARLEPSQRALIEKILDEASGASGADGVSTLVALTQKLSGKAHAHVPVTGKLRSKKGIDRKLISPAQLAQLRQGKGEADSDEAEGDA